MHNQCIERLWRDIHHCVTEVFYYYLEYHGLLNPISEIHIFAVYYVFLPHINESLIQFKDAWNNHKIHTEQGLTPNQLFTSEALQLGEGGLSALVFFYCVHDDYGVEEDGITPYDDDEGVEVTLCGINLSADQLEGLKESTDPLSDSDDFGINIYEHVVANLQMVICQDSDYIKILMDRLYSSKICDYYFVFC